MNELWNYLGNTPLRISCSNNNLEIAKLLLKNPEDIGIKNNFSTTPFLAAVINGNLDLVRYLFRFSPNLDINSVTLGPNDQGFTALRIAAKDKIEKMIEAFTRKW